MFVTRKEFQNYKGCSHNTALKKYKQYLIKVGKDPDLELTIYDLARVDNLPLEIVKQRVKGN